MMTGPCALCCTLILKTVLAVKRSDTPGVALLLAALVSLAILTGCAGITGASKSNSTPTGSAVAPAITGQPASVAVIAGQTATFSVAATGSGTLTYQWSKNNLAISGANSASYTTPPASSSDDKAAFSVTVTNSAGSATSSPAVLTVNPATAILTPNTTSLPFGNVILGSNSILGVTFTNSGNSSVSISNVTISGAGFTAS